ncbi:P-loop NTPase fold protein, partial [Metabacillus niabensis]|uniref:P-loop NTPase fold protein n=1 Tax=Metabacillus niabensis TaxID=324854 RepID=UPI0039A11C22
MKSNEIVKILNDFNRSEYQKVLITGSWGIGKTKYVKDFMENQKNITTYYLSLFGKKDINSILQELYFHIIEDAYVKKSINSIKEKLKSVDFSYFGFSLSIPFIEDLHKKINKELDRKDTTCIFIFDDLERKHNDLCIKEVFGLIDSLSKISNIKTVLITAKEQLDDNSKKDFENYEEKAIDRTYKIEEYSDDAPVNILGKDIWDVIDRIAEEFKFKNLRTFEKTNLFIKEIINVLGEEVFTNKFTKADLYRMAFASVLFKIEHKNKKILLDTGDETNNSYMQAFYEDNGDLGVIGYLNDYILKNSLDNTMSKNVFHYIRNWFETGTYNKEIILKSIESINSFEENPQNFYSSEQEILSFINLSRDYIMSLKGNERLEDIISRISNAISWCKILSTEFGISNEDILNLLKNNIKNYINLEESIYQNQLNTWLYHSETEEGKNIVVLINEAIKLEYFSELLIRIKQYFDLQSYDQYNYIKVLVDSIVTITENTSTENIIKDKVIRYLNDNNYFFPLPSENITNEQWNWCHRINELIQKIERHWNIENYYLKFTSYLLNLEITENDKMRECNINCVSKECVRFLTHTVFYLIE